MDDITLLLLEMAFAVFLIIIAGLIKKYPSNKWRYIYSTFSFYTYCHEFYYMGYRYDRTIYCSCHYGM